MSTDHYFQYVNNSLVSGYDGLTPASEAAVYIHSHYRNRILSSPFPWLGKEDRNNSDYRLNDKTGAMMLMAIGYQDTSLDYNIQVCEDVFLNIILSSPQATMGLRVGQIIETDESSLTNKC